MPCVFSADTAVDVTPNAQAPLADWALPLQQRAVFVRGGRGPDDVDCMGVVLFGQERCGRHVPNYRELYHTLDISRTGDVDRLFNAEAKAWHNVEKGGVGDVLVLGSGGLMHHVAILCGAGRALHALETAGVLIDPLQSRARVRRFAGLSVFGLVAPG